MKRATRPAEIVAFCRMHITKCRFTNGEFLETDVTDDNQRPWSSLSVVSHSLRNANRSPGLHSIVGWKETVTGAGFESAPPSETATRPQRLRPLGHPAWLLTIECRKHCQQAKEIIWEYEDSISRSLLWTGFNCKDMIGRSKPLFDFGLQSIVLSLSNFF